MQRLRDLPLRTKLLMVLLLVSLVPMSISAFLFYSYAVTAMATELGTNSVQIIRQVQNKVDLFYKQLDSLGNMLNYSPDVQHLLTLKEKQIDGRSLVMMNNIEQMIIMTDQYRQLFSLTNRSNNELKGIFIYTDERILIHNVLETRRSVDYPFHDQPWFQQIATADKPILISEHIQEYVVSKPAVVTFAKRLQSSKDFTDKGTLFIDISSDVFEHFLSDIQIGETGFVFFMDNEGKPVYQSARFPEELIDNEVTSIIRESSHGSLTKLYKGKKTQISYSTSELTGWTTVAVVPWSEIGQELRRTIRVDLIVLLIIAALVILFVSGLFSRRLTNPMLKLKQAMRMAESGNFTVRIDLGRKDEFGILGDNFNRMLQEQERLQQEIIETRMREVQLQLYRKESELLALRAQIDPHFLYNTLNTMASIGEVHNVQEVTQLSSALGEMFHYSSTGEHYSTLKEEMNHVNAYLTIMRMRYKNRYEIYIQIPDYMMDVQVVKMMLQPVVENAFQHGLENRTNGLIDIVAVEKNGELVITVLDNGQGMSETKLEQLKAQFHFRLSSDFNSKHHIGLYNVHKRLQLHYEGNAYLDIASELGRGTVVSIHIPFNHKFL